MKNMIEKLARHLWKIHAHTFPDEPKDSAWENLAKTYQEAPSGDVSQEWFLQIAESIIKDLNTHST